MCMKTLMVMAKSSHKPGSGVQEDLRVQSLLKHMEDRCFCSLSCELCASSDFV